MVADSSFGNGHPLIRETRSTIGDAFSRAIGESYRSIWISDLHLGTRAYKAEKLFNFLHSHRAENLYLVGDIIDGWNLGSSWYWSSSQSAVVREIASWHSDVARVVFLPGNHDEPHLTLVRDLFGSIQIVSELIHRTAEGCRMLVIHGHQFDSSLSSGRWLSVMGSQAYTFALRIDQWHRRERFRFEERAFASYLRRPLSRAVHYFTWSALNERAVFERVRQHKADGMICGHTHRVEQRLIGPIWYINDGDWVDSCTALVEEHNGALRLLRWGFKQTGLLEPDSIFSEEAS